MTLTHPIRVRYAETDQMGIVHHSAYVVWMEEGRTVLLEALGLPYHRLEAEGLYFPVVELEVRYHRPLHYGEVAELKVWIEAAKSRKVVFGYRVEHRGRRVAEGRTVHVPQAEGARAVRMPAEILAKLQAAVAT
jgi:acyl-CoA thioester hydrolase